MWLLAGCSQSKSVSGTSHMLTYACIKLWTLTYIIDQELRNCGERAGQCNKLCLITNYISLSRGCLVNPSIQKIFKVTLRVKMCLPNYHCFHLVGFPHLRLHQSERKRTSELFWCYIAIAYMAG